MAAKHIGRNISPFSDPLDGEFGWHVYRDVSPTHTGRLPYEPNRQCQHPSTSEQVICRRLSPAFLTRRSRCLCVLSVTTSSRSSCSGVRPRIACVPRPTSTS